MKKKTEDTLWFTNVVNDIEHQQRINQVLDINDYLLRKHKVLLRPDTQFKDEVFNSAKIVINTIRSIIDMHVSYVIGNPVSISGDDSIENVYNKVYKKGGYNKTDFEITSDLYKYGNAFEYVHLDGNRITSKVINNADAYPVYGEKYNYTHFIEHWRDISGNAFYIVYYPDRVEEYKNSELVNEQINLTGLPIHYAAIDRSEYSHFGDGLMLDLIPIMDAIEYLLSYMDDSVIRLSLNPIGVAKGRRVDEKIPKDMVGAVLNMEDGDGDFKWASNELDYNSVKVLLEHLIQNFYATAGIPSSVFGQSNISNVSETSLKFLFAETDNKARKTIHSLKEGMFKRFDYMRKLLQLNDITFTDDIYDTLDINFNINRPVDTESLIEGLKTQRDMGAISIKTIIEKSPYTVDVSEEIKRIEAENNNNNNSEDIENE